MRGTEQDTGRIGDADRAAAADAVEPVPVSSKADIPCAAFTPGPWEAHNEGGIAYGIAYRAVTSGNVVVAQVAKIPEGQANARLIAASPTMAEYIQRRADGGDEEAVRIMEAIHARS